MSIRTKIACAREFERGIADELWPLGFRRRQRGLFTAAIAHGVLAWLGLNRAIEGDGPVEFNPVVGVRHQRLQRLVSTLMGRKPHPYSPPTLSTNIGYLTASESYKAWFVGEGDIQHEVSDLAREVQEVALPFARAHTGLSAITDAMTRDFRLVGREERDYRLPAALLLQDRQDEAIAVVEAAVKRRAGEIHPEARQYRAFAQRFRAQLGAGTVG